MVKVENSKQEKLGNCDVIVIIGLLLMALPNFFSSPRLFIVVALPFT